VERIRGPVDAEVLRAVDGDTIAVRAHVWPEAIIATNVRLRGVDTPEKNSRCPAERELAKRATALTAILTSTGTATLMDIEVDKYGGRVLATVYGSDGLEIGAKLINAGLARPYDGGTRQPWCPDASTR
jgi:micrococcal nuclease